MIPSCVAAQETLKFIERNARLPGAKVLEVGCGRGELAKALAESGSTVVALDKSEDAVAAACLAGVNAVQSDLSEYFPDDKFDVVVFSRSLHHIHPPAQAMEATIRLLKPSGGLVLVEDFSVDIMDDRTLEWIRNVHASLPASVRKANGENQHAFPVGSLDEWKEHHLVKHKVAITADLIEAAKCVYARVRSESAAPYLFRYLVDELAQTPAAGIALQQILDFECQSINFGRITGIGLRLIAQN